MTASRLDFLFQQRLQQMSMAMPLLLSAMTKQRNGLLLRQVLKQTQRELLPVILDSLVPRIYTAGFQ